MPGVRQERERSGPPATQRLDDREYGRQRERNDQSAPFPALRGDCRLSWRLRAGMDVRTTRAIVLPMVVGSAVREALHIRIVCLSRRRVNSVDR